MQGRGSSAKKDPFDLYDEDEDIIELPPHMSDEFLNTTDLSQPIFMIADDSDLEDDDPFKEDDPALSAMLSSTVDWTTEGETFSIEDGDSFDKSPPQTTNDKPQSHDQVEHHEPLKDTSNQEPKETETKKEDKENNQSTDKEEGNGEDTTDGEKEDHELFGEGAGIEAGEDGQSATEIGNDLQEEVEARFRGELMRQSVDMVRLRHLCKTYGIPDGLRGDIWKHLLGAEKQPANPMNGWTPPHFDKKIHADLMDACDATRPELPFFRERETIELMQRVLLFYCERRTIPFKAGFNELLAPFLLLNLPEGIIFNCFYAFLSKYLPVLFTTDETVEPCIYELFRLLVLYHDPELCSHLDQNNLRPQQVVSAWLSSFFASACNIEIAMLLWDFIFVAGDPFIHYFIALALLVSKRELLLPLLDKDNILIMLAKTRLTSKVEVEHLIKKAQYYESAMPKSFRQQLFATTFHTNEFNTWIRRYLHAKTAFSVPTCLQVSVAEVVHAATTTESGVKFFVFDCRPLEQYNSGRLPTAFHLPPRMLLEKPEEFRKLLGSFEPLKGNHFCFFGAGQTELETYLQLIVLQFLQKGFKHISIVHGGYEALHTLLQTRGSKGIELLDHDTTTCVICVNQAKQPQQPPSTPTTATTTSSPQQPQQQQTDSGAPRKSSDGGSKRFTLPSIEAPKLPQSLSSVPLPSSLISNLGSSLASSISIVREKSTTITSNITTSLSTTSSDTILPSIINVLGTKDDSKKKGAVEEDAKGPMPLFTLDDDEDDEKEIELGENNEIEMEMELPKLGDEEEEQDKEKENKEEPASTEEGQKSKVEEPPKETPQQPQPQPQQPTLPRRPSLSMKSFMFWSKGEDQSKGGDDPKDPWGLKKEGLLPPDEKELERRQKELELEKERELASKREMEKEREKEIERARERSQSLEQERPTTTTTTTATTPTTTPRQEEPKQPTTTPTTTTTTPTTTPTTPTTTTEAPKRGGFLSWFYGPQTEDILPKPSEHSDKYSEDNYFQFDTYIQQHQNWQYFFCQKLFEEAEPRSWYLVVTQAELLELRVHPTESLMVALDSSHPLKEVTKITFKKTNPNLLTFEFNGQIREQYLIPNPMECIQTVRKAIENYLEATN